ncbi:hypothetical protein GCM10023100_00500 [Actinocorallia cavernae]|uniref:Uncharacterized protein n=2 Tax=Actinomycetes TaxID=1760 RepID=A0ABN3KJZ4_9ACTN
MSRAEIHAGDNLVKRDEQSDVPLSRARPIAQAIEQSYPEWVKRTKGNGGLSVSLDARFGDLSV